MANVNMANMLLIAVNTRDKNKVAEAIKTLPEEATAELNVALERAVSNYITDVKNISPIALPARSIGGSSWEPHDPKLTLEIIQLLLDNGASTQNDDIWSNIQMEAQMNPYLISHRRELLPLIFILRQNLKKETADEFFGMVSDIAEEFMTPEQIKAVLENSAAMAYIFPELLPESLTSIWNRRGHALKSWAMTRHNGNNNYNGNGGGRRRHKTRNNRSKKRKHTRRGRKN